MQGSHPGRVDGVSLPSNELVNQALRKNASPQRKGKWFVKVHKIKFLCWRRERSRCDSGRGEWRGSLVKALCVILVSLSIALYNFQSSFTHIFKLTCSISFDAIMMDCWVT